MSVPPTLGIHHVSVITGSSAETLDFYTEVLGLKLVKRTVNYDDQFMHHLYFGDAEGRPGSLLTCFPAERGQEGRVGKPQPTATSLCVPPASIPYWRGRLAANDVPVEPETRFDDPVLRFTDREGQPLELVGAPSPVDPWDDGPVPVDHAVRGLHGVTLASASPFQTASVLEALGLELAAQAGDRVRYVTPGDRARVVDVLDRDLPYGREGIGTAHHVAFRARDDEALEAWRALLVEDGLEPTRPRDRTYFRSVYVREPGGILVEVATDGPGLSVDEPVDALGSELRLPIWLEADREMIVAQLPPLDR